VVTLRDFASPPVFTPMQYRLADAVDGPHPFTGHQALGVMFKPDSCTMPLQTTTACVSGIGATKTTTGSIPNRGADSFAVYTWLDCPLVGTGEAELKRATQAAHQNNVQYVVERVFWTGGDFNTSQHLAEDTAIIETVGGSTVNLQTAASVIVTGAVDVVEGISRLEQAMADCYGGTPLIHVPRGVTAHLAANHQVEPKGSRLLTRNGSVVIPAPGYPGTSPAGVAPAAGTTWLYATGSVKMWQSEIKWQSRDAREFLNRTINDTVLILEQRFMLAWDCCHFAIPVSLGGIITGTFNSAT
jgi:hypothetical protein